MHNLLHYDKFILNNSIYRNNKFLNQLPLYQFFDKLISIPTTPNKKHDECESLNGYDELQKICNRLGNILDKITGISTLVDADNNKNNITCKYLDYFIQEEIEKEQCDSKNLPSLYEALNKYKDSYLNYKCDFVQNTNNDTTIYHTIKQVNFYAEYLYWLNQNYNNITNANKTDYYEFLNVCVLYYNRLLKHDTCIEINKYQTQLNEFKKEYDQALEAIKITHKDINPIPMHDENRAKESCSTDSKKVQELESDVFTYFSTIPSGIRAQPISPRPALSNSGDTIQADAPEDSQGSTFTPLGTYLRRNKLIDRNRMDEKQDDNYKLLSDASRIPHNIAYQPYISIQNSIFYKIYQEFDKTCARQYYDGDDSCYFESFDGSSLSDNVISILKILYSNLYRVYVSSVTDNNDYFPDYLDEVENIGCICLKYWLYDQIVSRGLSESENKILFNGYQNYINGKTQYIPENYCNFSELSLNHINTLKNIYALYTIFYNNTKISEACNNDKCKYKDYFGKGLDDFINSIKRCTSNSPNDNYCNEFNEFIKMCKKNSEYAGILIYDEPVQSTSGKTGKYLLSVEKYRNEPLHIYLKNEKLLNFVKTSDFLSNKKNTIAATSIVGSAIGLPSIFYYLYKVNQNPI
ncbi:hypothetical protein PVMG_02270 [Plasmodium vivax Mauritania I]|uniref:VIR protein n=1 Tax=Plasmodium vivax Mauritania I TaxID=1035515 RepID=A0A0J9TFR9_PLAVI|nr:hypothetical protein PVMG_02270 [Plasmodium vivax Mauritania I]